MYEELIHTKHLREVKLLILLNLIFGFMHTVVVTVYDPSSLIFFWFGTIILISTIGYRYYIKINTDLDNIDQLDKWYRHLQYVKYAGFALWSLIFSYYIFSTNHVLQEVSLIAQLGATVIATTTIMYFVRTYQYVLFILMLPIFIYYAFLGSLYGYFLALYIVIFWLIAKYAADFSFELLHKNYYATQFDGLTSLTNRESFYYKFNEKYNHLKRYNKYTYIMLIDIDFFKSINDSYGHDIGDKLLKEVAYRISSIVNVDIIVSRFGGDEFVLTGSEFDTIEETKTAALDMANKIRTKIKGNFLIEEHTTYVTASIGVSIVDNYEIDINEYIKQSDIAMYEAKDRGRDQVVVFTKKLLEKVEESLAVETRIYQAILEKKLFLLFQPIMNKNSVIHGCEVLARWNDESLGSIAPETFIKVAEKTGHILGLGRFIFKESLMQLKLWDSKGVDLNSFSINISSIQLLHDDFLDDIKEIIKECGAENLVNKVTFEITETVLVHDIHKAINIIHKIKSLGICIAIDDFGIGYSSLSYLKELPVDEIKIDKIFIERIGSSLADEKMIISIISMAKIFDAKITAEWVETKEQYDFLVKNSCDRFQGYYFSSPLSKEQFEVFYKEVSNNI